MPLIRPRPAFALATAALTLDPAELAGLQEGAFASLAEYG